MTTQAFEKIEYRNKSYSLIGEPLLQYLEHNEHIRFGMYSTTNWRGYQGDWLLKDNCLYIKKIESSNHNLDSIFGTTRPVFASWFSGKLKFGIGQFHFEKYTGWFEKYLVLDISSGKVLKRKIECCFERKSTISFGRYKGISGQDLIYGKLEGDRGLVIKNYLKCLIDYLILEDFNERVQSPQFLIEAEDIRLIDNIRRSKMNYFLTFNCIAFDSVERFGMWGDISKENAVSHLLERILKGDFTQLLTLNRRSFSDLRPIAEDSILVNPDFSYLEGEIRTNQHFCVSPGLIADPIKYTILKSFEIKRLNNFVFEYEPIFIKGEFLFSDEVQLRNLEKFISHNNIVYDANDKIWVPKLTSAQMAKQYGFYLNESYIQTNQTRPFSSEKYDPRDWLRDAAGTDDPEMMNDAFWNLD